MLPAGQATIACDLGNAPVPADIFEGVDVVIHLAGIAHQRASAADYHQVNVEGSRRLAQAASAAGVRRFIFLSSVKAMGASSSTQPRTEEDVTQKLTAYGASKREAEQVLAGISESTDMAVVILRPALIYGPGAKGNLSLIARAVSLGVPCPVERGRRSMLSLAAALELFVLLVETSDIRGYQCWIVCDDEGYSAAEIYRARQVARQRNAGNAWLPHWAWKVGTAVVDLISGSAGDSSYEKLYGTELYSNNAVKAAAGWRPAGNLQEWAQNP